MKRKSKSNILIGFILVVWLLILTNITFNNTLMTCHECDQLGKLNEMTRYDYKEYVKIKYDYFLNSYPTYSILFEQPTKKFLYVHKDCDKTVKCPLCKEGKVSSKIADAMQKETLESSLPPFLYQFEKSDIENSPSYYRNYEEHDRCYPTQVEPATNGIVDYYLFDGGDYYKLKDPTNTTQRYYDKSDFVKIDPQEMYRS